MARLNEINRLQKIAGIIKENVNEAPIMKPSAGGNVKAEVDNVIKAEYPGARKIDDALLDDLYVQDNYKSIAYYILKDLPGADEYGLATRNTPPRKINSLDHEAIAAGISQHIATGRIFVFLLNDDGEPEGSYGQSSGEIVDGQFVREIGREGDVD